MIFMYEQIGYRHIDAKNLASLAYSTAIWLISRRWLRLLGAIVYYSRRGGFLSAAEKWMMSECSACMVRSTETLRGSNRRVGAKCKV